MGTAYKMREAILGKLNIIKINSNHLVARIMSSKGWKWGGIYLLVIIIFSLVYWRAWTKNPESFIINSELNLQPLFIVHQTYWYLGASKDDNYLPLPQNLRNYQELAIQDYNKIKKLHIKRSKLEDEIYTIDQKRREIDQIIKEKKDNYYIEHYNKTEIDKTEREIDKIRSMIDQGENFSTGYLAPYLEQLSSLNNKLTQERNQLWDKYEDKKDYIESQFLTQYTHLKAQSEDLEKERKAQQNVINNAHEKVKLSYLKWQSQRRNAMGFLDFFYYSVGISTTTTFGDIVANNKFIRFIISLQLILSIFILGGFVNSVKLSNVIEDK